MSEQRVKWLLGYKGPNSCQGQREQCMWQPSILIDTEKWPNLEYWLPVLLGVWIPSFLTFTFRCDSVWCQDTLLSCLMHLSVSLNNIKIREYLFYIFVVFSCINMSVPALIVIHKGNPLCQPWRKCRMSQPVPNSLPESPVRL